VKDAGLSRLRYWKREARHLTSLGFDCSLITPFLQVFSNFRRAEKNTFDIRINAGKEAEELRELEDPKEKKKDEIKDMTELEDTLRKATATKRKIREKMSRK
jgi:hypothetical protein